MVFGMKKMRFCLRVFVVALFMPFAAFAEDFTINYELNGGTAASSGMPGTYTAGIGATISGEPRYTRGTFAGWCLDSGLTDCAMQQTISDTDSGDKTFYAKWTCNSGFHPVNNGQSCEANQYTLTYDCGTDATGTPPASATVSYYQVVTPPKVMKNSCEKPGYILSGWAVSGTDHIRTVNFYYTYTESKTLTAQWESFDPNDPSETKFTLTTTNMSANSTFKYWQGSTGKFYVDWGDGTLQTIYDKGLISHTYESAGVHTIRFGGLATEHYHNTHNGQSGGRLLGSIMFGNFYPDPYADNPQKDNDHSGTPEFISQISGSLGAIYPSLSVANLGRNNQPIFTSTFEGCTNLIGQIPANLFSGVTGVGAIDGCTQTNLGMFYHTFRGCENLGRDGVGGTSTYGIPAALFGDLSNAVPSTGMFQSTFDGCSGLSGSIPAGLFSGVVGTPSAGLFNRTFDGCTGLGGSIPANLFENISGDASTVVLNCGNGGNYTVGGITYTTGAVNAFNGTFYNCTGLTGSIPENLFGRVLPNGTFSGITGNAPYLFNGTFDNCTGLTGSIPENLFAGITGNAPYLFSGTFYNCTGLTGSIPENLFGRVLPNGTFSGITGNAPYLFNGTFNGLENITGTIPENLFGRVLKDENNNDVYYGVSGAAPSMFRFTFQGTCSIETPIPPDLFTKTVNGIDYGVSGTAVSLFQSTFNHGRCGKNGLPESGLTGYVDPQLFAGVTGNSTDIFTATFRNTRMDTVCPCGYHSTNTAWGINTIPASNTYNPANDPTGKDAPRAVCVPGLKTFSRDGVNEYYYDGDQSKCVTGCGYSLNLQQSGAESPLSYSLVEEPIVNPSMALQIGGDRCYLPFTQNSSASGVAGELNMKMGNDYYHPGEMVTE